MLGRKSMYVGQWFIQFFANTITASTGGGCIFFASDLSPFERARGEWKGEGGGGGKIISDSAAHSSIIIKAKC